MFTTVHDTRLDRNLERVKGAFRSMALSVVLLIMIKMGFVLFESLETDMSKQPVTEQSEVTATVSATP